MNILAGGGNAGENGGGRRGDTFRGKGGRRRETERRVASREEEKEKEARTRMGEAGCENNQKGYAQLDSTLLLTACVPLMLILKPSVRWYG